MPVNKLGGSAAADMALAGLSHKSGFAGQPVLSLTGDQTRTGLEKIETLAREFESIFMNQMIKSMRATVDRSGLIDGGSAERVYTDLLDETLSREMAFSQRDGLSAALVEQLSRLINAERNQEDKKDPEKSG